MHRSEKGTVHGYITDHKKDEECNRERNNKSGTKKYCFIVRFM